MNKEQALTVIAKLMREARTEKRWKQSDVAKHIGVKQPMISSVENAKKEGGVFTPSNYSKAYKWVSVVLGPVKAALFREAVAALDRLVVTQPTGLLPHLERIDGLMAHTAASDDLDQAFSRLLSMAEDSLTFGQRDRVRAAYEAARRRAEEANRPLFIAESETGLAALDCAAGDPRSANRRIKNTLGALVRLGTGEIFIEDLIPGRPEEVANRIESHFADRLDFKRAYALALKQLISIRESNPYLDPSPWHVGRLRTDIEPAIAVLATVASALGDHDLLADALHHHAWLHLEMGTVPSLYGSSWRAGRTGSRDHLELALRFCEQAISRRSDKRSRKAGHDHRLRATILHQLSRDASDAESDAAEILSEHQDGLCLIEDQATRDFSNHQEREAHKKSRLGTDLAIEAGSPGMWAKCLAGMALTAPSDSEKAGETSLRWMAWAIAAWPMSRREDLVLLYRAFNKAYSQKWKCYVYEDPGFLKRFDDLIGSDQERASLPHGAPGGWLKGYRRAAKRLLEEMTPSSAA